MAARPYKRLPGRHNGLFYVTSLWEAEDHLLLVESYRVSESYRRFFYRDIQAVVICRTVAGLVITIVMGVLAAGFGALAALFEGPRVACVIFAAVFLALAVLEILRGPTCRSTLRTAVQTQRLPSLGRLRVARKAILRIQSRIEAAQGQPVAP